MPTPNHPAVPARYEEFSLTRSDGTEDGPFRLVSIDVRCHDLGVVKDAIREGGFKTVETTELETFQRKYPTPDGKGPIGVATTTTYLHQQNGQWSKTHGWVGGGYSPEYRWLVKVPREENNQM